MNHATQKLLSKLRNSSKANFVIASIVGLSVAIIGYTAISGQAASVKTSLKSGNWSDVTVWGGTLPQADDTVVIATGHNVTYDIADSTIAGMTINSGGTLTFTPSQTTLLKSSENIIVNGKLVMKPNSASVIQTLRFINVDETAFVGGGMNPVDSDVGLWVMGSGQMDLQGTPKKAWTRTVGSANQSATSLSLQDTPTGWAQGDEVVISPTALDDYSNFDPRSVTSVSGNTVNINSGLSGSHPSVTINGKIHTPEVMNLTRNVRIEGTQPQYEQPRAGQNNTNGGRAHIFIRSTKHQIVNYVQIRHMAPRKSSSNCWITSDCSQPFVGRYGLHWHHGFDGSRGSKVIGTVIRDAGSNAFVPHASHGVHFHDTIAYNVYDNAYWWDPPYAPDDNGRQCVVAGCADGISDDTLWERAVAAHVKIDERASDSATGFALQKGLGNSVRDSVAVGLQGHLSSGGFAWMEGSAQSPWQMVGNVAHNNVGHGIFWWQVDEPIHPVEQYTSYRNGINMVRHGAYLNNAHYTNFSSYQDGGLSGWGGEAPLHSIAQSSGGAGLAEGGQFWRDGFIDVGGRAPYAVHLQAFVGLSDPIRFERLTVKGYTEKPVLLRETNDEGQNDGATRADLICWSVGDTGRDLEPTDIDLQDAPPGYPAWDDRAIIRVQRKDGTAFQISGNKVISVIPQFSDCGTAPSDLTRPTAPTGLSATTFTDSEGSVNRVELTWTPSTDNTGIKEYHVTRVNNGGAYGFVSPTNSLSDTRLSYAVLEISDPEGSLFYNVTAVDFAGNRSDASLTIEVDLATNEVKTPTNDPESNPEPSEKLGDINNDGLVNIIDLSILLSNWNKTTNQLSNPKADINGDGTVTIIDLSTLLSRWGT